MSVVGCSQSECSAQPASMSLESGISLRWRLAVVSDAGFMTTFEKKTALFGAVKSIFVLTWS